MSKYYLGIDLGSTTSKAIIIDEKEEIIGRGITNTRANYAVAAEIAKQQAVFNARFQLLKKIIETETQSRPEYLRYLNDIENVFQYLQFHIRLQKLKEKMLETANAIHTPESRAKIIPIIEEILEKIDKEVEDDYLMHDLLKKNQFFRDIVSERYNFKVAKVEKKLFDPLMTLYDKSINPIENEIIPFYFKTLVDKSLVLLHEKYESLTKKTPDASFDNFDQELSILMGNYQTISGTLEKHINEIADRSIDIVNMVGTGYGRALLPFPQESIKSEILCHAFGAHAIFPKTRTLLDIGGQDTKAIQVDEFGLVTSFHMNDRCAAGCGRYLGYIADELNISLSELSPLAMTATKESTICSTCTVFAGAELRELMNAGENTGNILAGLHKAIVMRAISLIARSGGVKNEFTFTGGVARNKAVLKYVTQMVHENYGNNITINVDIDSIYMGALGAALFARKNITVALPKGTKEATVGY